MADIKQGVVVRRLRTLLALPLLGVWSLNGCVSPPGSSSPNSGVQVTPSIGGIPLPVGLPSPGGMPSPAAGMPSPSSTASKPAGSPGKSKGDAGKEKSDGGGASGPPSVEGPAATDASGSGSGGGGMPLPTTASGGGTPGSKDKDSSASDPAMRLPGDIGSPVPVLKERLPKAPAMPGDKTGGGDGADSDQASAGAPPPPGGKGQGGSGSKGDKSADGGKPGADGKGGDKSADGGKTGGDGKSGGDGKGGGESISADGELDGILNSIDSGIKRDKDKLAAKQAGDGDDPLGAESGSGGDKAANGGSAKGGNAAGKDNCGAACPPPGGLPKDGKAGNDASTADAGNRLPAPPMPGLPQGNGRVPTLAQAGAFPAPGDVGTGKDDDNVARQIREAASNEPNPTLRDRLWDEYRHYKQGVH